MLELKIVIREDYNEETEEFVPLEVVTLQLEHSLLSISKWESKHQKRFFDNEEVTGEEILDYIQFMNLTADFPPGVFSYLTEANMASINAYLSSEQTATTFPAERASTRPSKPQEKISSELVYYWMVKCGIPFEAENWNINRLFALIKIMSIKDADPKSRPQEPNRNIAAERAAENARRKAERQTSG